MSSGSAAASCNACHELARCHTTTVLDNSVDTVGVVCRCEDGLVGDGFTCHNKTTCGSGYRWSPQLGCVDIDECSQPNQPCGPGKLCQNSPGSFMCLPSPASLQPRAKPRSVQFTCEGVTCPEGQDCFMVNDGNRCDDPCVRRSLDHSERTATNYTKTSSCDFHRSNKWYEFSPLSSYSIRMPERCIEPKGCGTDIPLWLKTPHPALEDGIIQAEVCGKANGDCCFHKSNPIHVKACDSNRYVYRLSPFSTCNMGYCAGEQEGAADCHSPDSGVFGKFLMFLRRGKMFFLWFTPDVNTDVCNSCQDHEICVSDDKIHFRCELRGK